MNDEQSQFIAVCPDCSTILKVSVNKLGQHVRCSQCHLTFVAGQAIESATQRSGEQPALSSNQANDHVERIEAICPGCQATLHVRRAYIGNDVRCKRCNQVFQVRDPAENRAKPDHDQPETKQNPLQADHEQLYVAHNLLQADHDRLKIEHTELRENLGRVTAELDAIRAALGAIAPEAVGPMVSERQSLAEEVHRLRDEINALLAAQRERDQLAAERQEWVSELTVAHAERDILAKELKDRDDRLESVGAEHDRSRADQQTALGEIEQLQLTLAQSGEAARIERDHLRSEVENLRRELELAEQCHHVELERLNDQLAMLQEKQRQLQDEQDQAQERRDPEGQSSFASADSRRERWTGQQPVLGVFSDENGAQADPSRAAILTSDGASHAAAAEIEDLHAQLTEVKQRLEDSERLNRDMAAVLGGLGIRFRPTRL